MKKIILLIIGVCIFHSVLFSQSSNTNKEYRKNFIIFMDAKLFRERSSGHLEFIDSIGQKQVVKFSYDVGELIFEENEFEKINLCSKNNDGITMYLDYRDPLPEFPGYVERLYVLELNLSDFHAGSVVLMIVNIDKKKGKFAYDIYSDHITGWSSNYKAMKKSRELLLEHWVRKKDYNTNHNIFQRTWRSIRNWVRYW